MCSLLKLDAAVPYLLSTRCRLITFEALNNSDRLTSIIATRQFDLDIVFNEALFLSGSNLSEHEFAGTGLTGIEEVTEKSAVVTAGCVGDKIVVAPWGADEERVFNCNCCEC